MSNGNEKHTEQEINRIADELCQTITGNFDITIHTDSNNESTQKLSMIINFLLDNVRRNVSHLEKKGEMDQLFSEFSNNTLTSLEQATSFSTIIAAFIQSLCKILDFQIGHFFQYNIEQDALISSRIWHTEGNDDFREFINITSDSKFKKGEGLPGNAWQSAKHCYYRNIMQNNHFKRAKLIKKSLLKGGIAIPIFDEKKLLGVIECFSTNELNLSKEEISLINNITKNTSILYRIYVANRDQKLILNAAGEGIYVLDATGITTFVNDKACQLLEYRREELLGKPMHPLIHHSYSDGTIYPRNKCHVYAAYTEGKTSTIANEVFWKKDKSKLHVKYTCTPIYESNFLVGSVVTFTDSTEELYAKQYLDAITNIRERYIQGEPTELLFEYILSTLLKYTDSEYGFIGSILLDKDGNKYLKTHAITDISWDEETNKLYNSNAAEGLEFHNLDTLFGYAIKTGETIICNDPSSDPRSGGRPKNHPDLNAFLGVPILGSQEMIALCGVANRPNGYNEDIANHLKPLINTIGSILEANKSLNTIKRMAQLDQMTQIYNRSYFESEINNIIKEHQQSKAKFALLLLDLNRFKDINDRLGHAIGDIVLQQFSQRLQGNVKQSDLICRIGGDEFVIIIKHLQAVENAGRIAKKIHSLSNTPYHVYDYKIDCSCSIGIACYGPAGTSYKELMKHADFALYQAKKTNGYQYYTEELEQAFIERITLEEALPNAIKNHGIKLNFQPQVDLDNRQLTGFEVLARWTHPSLGIIGPGRFVQIAEDLGIAHTFNRYVVNQTMHYLNQLKMPLAHPLKVAINISPYTHNLNNHIQSLITCIQNWDIDPNLFTIELEVTESSFLNENSYINPEIIDLLKSAGIKIAIDDFGTRYSSINRLLELQIDTIKIDLSFTQRLDKPDNKAAIAIIETIHFLAKKINLTIVAEGVETQSQADILLNIGCQTAQGYLFHKPMSFYQLQKLINHL